MNGIIWDEVFLTGKIKSDFADNHELGSNESKMFACATALCGWANCMTGSKTPEKFGEGMLALAKFGGIDTTIIANPDKLFDLADSLKGA